MNTTDTTATTNTTAGDQGGKAASSPVSSFDPSFDYDIAIIGAGPVGLALAGWLAQRSSTQALRVALIDTGRPQAENASADPRVIAVSQGSRLLIGALGWPHDATPIKRIHVSQRGHFGRMLIDHADYGLPALGYVARYGSIVQALAGAVSHTHVRWLHGMRAFAPMTDDDGVTLSIGNADDANDVQTNDVQTIRTRIVVNAEGGFYERASSGDVHHRTASSSQKHARTTRDYDQTALIGIVTVSAPQPHVAWERFTPQGPLALLPMDDANAQGTQTIPHAPHSQYALVWCCAPDEAARRTQLPDAELLAELNVAFGARMGRFTHIAHRAAFPLGLSAANALVSGHGRIAAIGNAAQMLHPVSGQGMNLGLRDARTLADAFAQHGATPLALADFARRRAFDRRVTIRATDTLARMFTIDLAPLAILRGLALTALEFAPPLKTSLARHMMFGQRT